jgi:hypothetical protein
MNDGLLSLCPLFICEKELTTDLTQNEKNHQSNPRAKGKRGGEEEEEEEGSHHCWEKCRHHRSSVRRRVTLLSTDLSKKKRIHQSNPRVRGGKEGRGGG